MTMDTEYNLARLEGQIARIEAWNDFGGSGIELRNIIQAAKGFIASLRLSLDPHRIDVV